MVLINLVATSLAFATAANAFDMTCNADNTLTVNIPYDKPADILSVDYGSCSKDDVDVGVQDPDTHAFAVTLPISRCGMDGNLRTLQYSHKATIVVGRKTGATELIFSDFEVDAYCEYTTEYLVKFSYGELELESASYNNTGGTVSLDFEIAAYESSFANKTDNAPTRGGETIHLGLVVTSEGFNHERKTFAPTKCIISDVDDTAKNYTLFDTATSCKNDLIDLSVSFEDNMWRISHVLFLLGNQRSSTYELACNVKVCDSAKAEECNAVETACES